VGGYGEEAQPVQLLLDLPFGLVVTQRGRSMLVAGANVKVAEQSKEGALLGLGLLEVLALDLLLIEPSLGLVLAGGVLALVLALADVMLAGGVLVLLGAVGDEVVEISIAKASLVLTTMLMIQAVKVEPQEPTND